MGHYVRLVVVAASLLFGLGHTLAATESRNQTKALVSNTHVRATSSTEREAEERSGLTPALVDAKLASLKDFPLEYAEGFTSGTGKVLKDPRITLSDALSRIQLAELRNDFATQGIPPDYVDLMLYRALLHNIGDDELPILKAAKTLHQMRQDKSTKVIATTIEKAQFSMWFDFVKTREELSNRIFHRQDLSTDAISKITSRYLSFMRTRTAKETKRKGASTSQ